MERRKIVVLVTAVIAVFSLGGAAMYSSSMLPPPLAINTQGQPSIGEGTIEMVIFEDFLCKGCQVFSAEVFPQIFSHYIETKKARYTIVPLAFIEGSKPLANAALGVYNQAPERFFPFLRELFVTGALLRRDILSAARRVGGIDLSRLAESMDHQVYDEVLDRNLDWAKTLMGSQFSTPALFINGISTSTRSFEAIVNRIEQMQRWH